jgi:hypothetical protein
VNHRCDLGVPAFWSLGDSLANHQSSGFVWSGNDSFMQGIRRLLLRGKLRSENGVKVTGARGDEHCLCGKTSPTWRET